MKFKEPQEYTEYVSIQSSRSASQQNANSFWRDVRNASVTLDSNYKYFDIGCRLNIQTVLSLHEKGFDVYGCDIGTMCQEIWDRDLPNALKGKLKQWDIHDGNPFDGIEFDFITMSHVLEHCYDPIKVRTVVDICLAENGYLHSIIPTDSNETFNSHTPHRIQFESHDEHLEFWKAIGYELVYHNYHRPDSVAIFHKKLI